MIKVFLYNSEQKDGGKKRGKHVFTGLTRTVLEETYILRTARESITLRSRIQLVPLRESFHFTEKKFYTKKYFYIFINKNRKCLQYTQVDLLLLIIRLHATKSGY